MTNTVEKHQTDDLSDGMIIDFDAITLNEREDSVQMTEFTADDGIFLNTQFTQDFRIRQTIFDMVKKAQSHLPEGYNFVIYEAYRPRARQIELWNKAQKLLGEKYPDLSQEKLDTLAETYVANPYNGIGSGHQSGSAIDISLCNDDGVDFDMGTKCQEVNDYTGTNAPGLSDKAVKNRTILKDALENVGFINYPAEWWHFSYGDMLWAHLTKNDTAFHGPLPF